MSPTARMITNLRYSLEQLRALGQQDGYLSLVESLLVGPAPLTQSDAERLLGVDGDIFHMFYNKRRAMVEGGLRPSWEEGWHERRCRVNLSPERRVQTSRPGEMAPKSPRSGRWKCPDLHHQFLQFARFGETGQTRDGSTITLTQSDKWLRQAKVIDGWNLTTTDQSCKKCLFVPQHKLMVNKFPRNV